MRSQGGEHTASNASHGMLIELQGLHLLPAGPRAEPPNPPAAAVSQSVLLPSPESGTGARSRAALAAPVAAGCQPVSQVTDSERSESGGGLSGRLYIRGSITSVEQLALMLSPADHRDFWAHERMLLTVKRCAVALREAAQVALS